MCVCPHVSMSVGVVCELGGNMDVWCMQNCDHGVMWLGCQKVSSVLVCVCSCVCVHVCAYKGIGVCVHSCLRLHMGSGLCVSPCDGAALCEGQPRARVSVSVNTVPLPSQ